MDRLITPDLSLIESLYDRGLYLQAYEASSAFGALKDWRGVAGRILAGRLAGNLGSSRLSVVLHGLAWREHPGEPAAAYYQAHALMRRQGPYFTLRWMDRIALPAFAADADLAEWLALRARCYALLRDRERADAELARALELAPDSRWVAVERSSVYEHTDRYDRALEVIEDCLSQHPYYRPAVQSAAHLLTLKGRDEQAIDLLQSAIQRLECGSLHSQLASLYRQQQQIEAAREQYERAAEKMPLLDRQVGDAWLARLRSDLASACGEPDTALKLLESIPDRHKHHFHKRVEHALRSRSPEATRKQLDVRFIRQHFRTCAPATLAMIARYWGQKAEHMEIADAICFDGTPYHAERQWAEEAGYLVREFTVDLTSTQALIDRGVPFTFSTVEPGNGHLQAVIGYDTTRQTLLLRDPFYPTVGEILIESLAERYGAFGPRGMVFVPRDREHLLHDLQLTDQALWELSHMLRRALIDHDRAAAVRTLQTMREQDADATLTLSAELSLADYDNNAQARARLVEKLIERYPDCPALVPRRLGSLSERGLRHERLALLRKACEEENASSLLIHRYADELAEDAREHGRAAWHLRRLIRRDMLSGEAYHTLGGLRWKQGLREEAVALYHTAACIEDKSEHYAMTLFRAHRFFRQETQALALLQERFETMGTRDAGPARTLYEAYRVLARADAGFQVLDRAITKRPDDGPLMLFAAEERSAFGQHERAAELLEQARTRSRPIDWQRTAAELAEDAGRLSAARHHWQQVIDSAPLDTRALRRRYNLTQRLDGQAQALAQLRETADRFPHHWELQRELYDVLADVDIDQALHLLRRLLELTPRDAWAWRELGFRCVEIPGRLDEARQASDRAREIDAGSYSTWNLVARVAEIAGQIEEARHAYREAIRADPDNTYAIEQLIEQYTDRAGRREATRYILNQLAEQVTFGQGVQTYQRVANRALTPAEVLEDLRQAIEHRPDLWQTWAALIDQLLLTDQIDEAVQAAADATERFPLVAGMWYRRAEVHRVRLETRQQAQHLEQAIRIAPNYPLAIAELAEAYEYLGDADDAERVLRQAIDREPRSARYHTRLAELLWRRNQPEQALATIQSAVRLAPDAFAGWSRYIEWSKRAGDADAPGQLARELAHQSPADPDLWLMLAEVLERRQDLEERLDAIERCLALRPRESSAHDLKARLLLEAHRYEQALAACDPPAFAGSPPFNLRGRACWILYQRGEHQQAIQQLWQIIEDEPTYAWGLKQLIDWCGDENDFEGQVRASNLLIQMDPNDHVALGYRAHARLQQAQDTSIPADRRKQLRQLAKEDLARASRLVPSYTYGSDRLFNLQLDDNELDDAEQTLGRAGEFLDAECRLSMRVALACKRGDKSAAGQALRELCKVPTDEGWVFAYAYDHADKLGIARPIIKALCKEADANPLIAEHIVRPLINQRQWAKAFKATRTLRHWPDGWDRAAGYLLTDIGESHDTSLRHSLEVFYYRNRKRIAQGEHAWNGAIYACAGLDLCKCVIQLFKDRRPEQELAPWMLCNLVNAYLTLGKLDLAEQTLSQAMDLPPDHSYPRHLIDLAHIQALRQQTPAARQSLDQVVIGQLPGYYQFTYYITRALIEAQATDRPAEAQTKADEHLQKARDAHPGFRKDRGAVAAYRRVVWALSRIGNPWQRARAIARYAATIQVY